VRDGLTIYVLRHGQTDWNVEARFQGHTDVPLNDIGRAQAAANGATLARTIHDPLRFAFVSSPLSRATETMKIVRRALSLHPDAYSTDPRLREIHGGAHQGLLAREIFGADERHLGDYAEDRWHFQHPGGESYAMLHARVVDWLGSVKRDTVVTAHGGVVRCLRQYVEGLGHEAALRTPVPQDKVLIIRAGAFEWV